MKTFILAVLCSVVCSLAVGEGDIAFVQFNSDGEDIFKFVCLVDIPGNSVIHFTDNGWLAAGGFREGEGTLSWTVQPQGVAAGTVVTIAGVSSNNFGQVSGSGRFAIAADGDQIIAYYGNYGLMKPNLSIDLITAINCKGDSWQDDATDTHTSALPAGLSSGTALALREADNAIYNGAVLSGRPAFISAAIHNPNNWIYSDADALQFTQEFTMQTLAIEFVHFSVGAQNDSLQFKWEISPDASLAGFHIFARQTISDDWQKLTPHIITGIPHQQKYSATLANPSNFAWFMVEAISNTGETVQSETMQLFVTHVAGQKSPNAFTLLPAFPNPFNPCTCIKMQLPNSQHVNAEIFNLLGKKIRTLMDNNLTAGEQVILWDGKADDGQALPAGVYFVHINCAAQSRTQKLFLIR